MNDSEFTSPAHAPVSRLLAYVAALIIGLLLLVLGGLTLINASTKATNTLVHRGDCRAQHQGDYFTHLSELVVEATKPDSDTKRLEDLAEDLKVDAQLYKNCAPQSGDTGPSTLPVPSIPLRPSTSTSSP